MCNISKKKTFWNFEKMFKTITDRNILIKKLINVTNKGNYNTSFNITVLYYLSKEMSKRKGNTHDISDIFVVWIFWEKEILSNDLRATFSSELCDEEKPLKQF